MKIKSRVVGSFLMIFMSFGVGKQALSRDFSEDINIADRKVILEQYEAAKVIYQRIIASSDFSVVAAYAHYKLGSLHKQQNEPLKAKLEYERGLESLKAAGEDNHQIGRFLLRALQVAG